MRRGIRLLCIAAALLVGQAVAVSARLPGFYVWRSGIIPAVLEASRADVSEARKLFAPAGEF